MTTASATEFRYTTFDHAPDRILPQRIGRVLWLPMLLLALMAFAVGIVAAILRADAIASGEANSIIAAQGHLLPGLVFLGFASVFAATSFAIVQIVGKCRVGGSRVQETAGAPVQALRMPGTAKLFIVRMMMMLLAAIVLRFVAAAAIAGGSVSGLANAETWAVQLEGVRRTGVAVYLLSILLGLATIVHVLRFQASRIREIAA